MATYLGSWAPQNSSITLPATPDYVVSSSGTYKTVQSAVNAAIKAGGSTRKYIQVAAGTYTGLVVIPSGTPITLYGAGNTSTVLQLGANYAMTGTQYKAIVNAADFGSSAPSAVQSYYNNCVGKGSSAIGTSCTAAVALVGANGFVAKNIGVTNSYGENNSAANGQHQAVALYNNGGDQVILDNVRLVGNQDTLWLASASSTSFTRTYVRNSFIEGDTDFIFGNGTAVFDGCEIRYTNARKSDGAIGAPSTEKANPYGFLFVGGAFTTTGGSNSVYFARQWPQSSGSSPIGRMIIRNANIGSHIRSTAPWKDWSSSQPVNYGSSSDPYLGEYLNTGTGAAK